MLVLNIYHFVQVCSLLQNKGILSLDMNILLVANGAQLINWSLLILDFLFDTFFTFADFINFF